MNKKLYRSWKNKMIAGVCSGLAEYFDIDPTIIRVIFVVSLFLGGSGVIAYIILWIVVPEQPYNLSSSAAGDPIVVPDPAAPAPDPVSSYQDSIDKRKHNRSATGGIILIVVGLFILAGEIFPRIDFGDFVSIALIIVGVILLSNSTKKN